MSTKQPKAAPGDWVSFYQGGKLVIGVVRHVRERQGYPWGTEVLCDIGAVDMDDIIECRPLPPRRKAKEAS